MKCAHKNESRGFALLELIIYLGLIGFVLSAAIMFSVEYVGTSAKSVALSESARNTKFAVSRIAYEVRSAESIDYGNSVFDSSPGTLVLETSNPATNPTVISVSGGQLMMSRGGGADIALTPSLVEVRNFVLSNIADTTRSRSVLVQLTLGTVSTGNLEEFSGDVAYETTVRVWKDDGFNSGGTPPPPTATLSQATYRWFANTDSTDVGVPLAVQDISATLAADGDPFRLRLMLDVDAEDLSLSGATMKLQFAEKSGSCDISFSGESYSDVTGSTAIAYNDNTPADAAALTVNVNDPTNGARTTIAQSYEEANNFTNAAAIVSGETGLWDFSLLDNDGTDAKDYCFRAVRSTGSQLNSYAVVPEISTAAAISCGVVFSDNFQDANASDWAHTWDAGGDWSVVSSSGSYVYDHNSATYSQTQAPSFADSDYIYTGQFTVNTYGIHGFIFRYQNDSNFWRLVFEGNQVLLRGQVAGTWVNAAGQSVVNWTPTTGVKYNVKIKAEGSQLDAKWWQNGSSEPGSWMISATDSSILTGYVGLSNRDNAKFDNLSVTTCLGAAPPVGSIDVSEPNGGESLTAEDSFEITWTSSDTSGSVDIEYSTDGFVSDVNAIASGTADDGSYFWTVPTVDSSTVRVRISDSADAGVTDMSDADFAISTPVPAFEQSGYRFFANADSTDVGAPLALLNTPAALGSDSEDFRLRTLLHVSVAELDAGGENFKLQFATKSGTCDTGFTGETYVDVTGATSIAFADNSPADGEALTANVNDPTHGGDSVVTETYEEANNFTTTDAIPAGEDGLWDFSLTDNDGTDSADYCLRIVKSDGSPLDAYSQIFEITTAQAPSEFEQSAYRFFANADSTDVGPPLAAQDSVAALATDGEAFRIRLGIDVNVSDLAISGESYKLQFATKSGTCDTGFTGETYADVTGVTAIAFNDNAPVDGAALTANASDPTRAGRTVVTQTYEEANNHTSTALIPSGDFGLWDFALVDNDGTASAEYCFRIVRSDNSPLEAYTVIPEVMTAAYVPQPTFRVTEYYVSPAISATNFSITLAQNLMTNYFVVVRGSDGNGSSTTGPDENYVSLIADPFGTGDLASTGTTDSLEFTRHNNVYGWVGVIQVVECMGDCDASGFTLLDVQRVAHTGSAISGTDVSGTSWSNLDQVMLFGGFSGAGCDTASTSSAYHKNCHVRIWPSGSNTINWSRNNGGVTTATATSTVMALEWGSEWTIQRTHITGTSGGNGADSTGEYDTSAISSVARDNTWVWGVGHTVQEGIGDSAEGVLVTLGNGVNQNSSESTLAAGSEFTANKDFEAYALTHSDLAVDYFFKTDGDTSALTVDVSIDAASIGSRMGLVSNGCNGTGTAYSRPIFSARYLSDTFIRLERRYSGQNFPAWVQGIDFSGITY